MTTRTERHEIEAWLGDDHGLNSEQIDELVRISDDIRDRYPDEDDREERETCLITAYRVMIGDTAVVEELAGSLQRARLTERRTLAGLRQAALTLIPAGDETQAGFARRAGVDRMAVREWLGLR